MENKLKLITVDGLESVIAKALSSAIGEKVTVSISSINYGRSLLDENSFQNKLWQPNTFFEKATKKKS